MTRLTSLALLGLVSAGCSGGSSSGYVPQPVPHVEKAEIKPGEETTLMPLKEGNSWTYAVEAQRMAGGRSAGNAQGELTYRVASTTVEGNATRATLELISGGKTIEKQEWLANDKGVFQIGVGEKTEKFTTPQPVILTPLKDHPSFEWRGYGLCPDGKFGNIIVRSKILDLQEVDSEIKRFSALPVESVTEYEGDGRKGNAASTTWFAPGVGIVRFKQEVVTGDRASIMLLKLKRSSIIQ